VKSFLQYISESELDFYLEAVQDHAEYQEWLKFKLKEAIIDLQEINTRLGKKIDVVESLMSRGYRQEQFSDKTTFKMFNSIDWNIKKFDEMTIEYDTTDLQKLVEAWTETEIKNKEGN